ncbi:response regulator [Tsuneonella sp. HG094]
MSLQSVLVAEDEMIIGVDLCDTVQEAGFVVDGPYDTARSAIDSLEKHKPDLAILDVRLDDGEVYPLADRLIAANVPVIFHSGEVAPRDVTARYPDALALAKPCPPDQIIAKMHEALATA